MLVHGIYHADIRNMSKAVHTKMFTIALFLKIGKYEKWERNYVLSRKATNNGGNQCDH